jgi:hypothetical protein
VKLEACKVVRPKPISLSEFSVLKSSMRAQPIAAICNLIIALHTDNIENLLFDSRVSNGHQSYRKHQLVGKTYRADSSPICRYLIRRFCVS